MHHTRVKHRVGERNPHSITYIFKHWINSLQSCKLHVPVSYITTFSLFALNLFMSSCVNIDCLSM